MCVNDPVHRLFLTHCCCHRAQYRWNHETTLSSVIVVRFAAHCQLGSDVCDRNVEGLKDYTRFKLAWAAANPAPAADDGDDGDSGNLRDSANTLTVSRHDDNSNGLLDASGGGSPRGGSTSPGGGGSSSNGELGSGALVFTVSEFMTVDAETGAAQPQPTPYAHAHRCVAVSSIPLSLFFARAFIYVAYTHIHTTSPHYRYTQLQWLVDETGRFAGLYNADTQVAAAAVRESELGSDERVANDSALRAAVVAAAEWWTDDNVMKECVDGR